MEYTMSELGTLYITERATKALPQAVAEELFEVRGGSIVVERIIGEITTLVGAVNNATKLEAHDAANTTDLCGTVELNAAAAGSLLNITGTLANAMVITALTTRAIIDQAAKIVVRTGSIDLNCAAADTGDGRIRWTLHWRPLQAGVTVVAV